ncbi:MAG: DUF1553 domain-containing protein [Bacteroidetes bacterium]|nr:MAG: DUF1553 domain-containing protein [Bacteroidota bacterium]
MRWNKKYLWLLGTCVLLLGLGSLRFISGKTPDQIDFNASIRPILNKKCLSCHGGVKRKGGLSLLFRQEALKAGDSGRPAIVPGKPEASEMVARIRHHDPEERMPLKEEALSQEEIRLIEKWIAQGAEWENHWAYLKPDAGLTPPDIQHSWIRNDIDRFVLVKMKEHGLSPEKEAAKATLLRRLSLDLTGLPPTPEEVQAFVQNEAEDAYEREVDRLLASPHFGERWAALWMDLARYADSQGYQKDRKRNIWPWREWVIQAFNADMPFDQFTVEQLAGDLLPQPSESQLLATAFHRNTMSNDEGGTDDEEFRVTAVIDRVNTTFEVWQGATIGCVQCHSHPYDPFRQKEYYQLYAFFNNTADADRTDEWPTRPFYGLLQQAEIRQIQQELHRLAGQHDTASRARSARLHSRLEAIRPVSVPIMQELPPDSSRTTHIFERGNWLVHGEAVQPGVPKALGPMQPGMPPNRLGLARWLVHPDNPLTARVMVNHFWEQLFGLGIVETLEDFGTQGARPTHPELLDWLAVKWMAEQGWSVKSLLKYLVMSATYRQASTVSPQKLKKDRRNRWLARGPRLRLTAEQIRDQALAVSGLLSPNMYGPSVMPPQPEGTWQVIRNVLRWVPSQGEDRYRRAIYTFWRRSSPYPGMITFDAPSREYCVLRRITTNTPLQALATLNDSVYHEAAQALAGRMWRAGKGEVQQALATGYALATARPPTPEKLQLLMKYYEQILPHYRQHPEDVRALITLPEEPTPELAALTMTAAVLLNLDEVIVKE